MAWWEVVLAALAAASWGWVSVRATKAELARYSTPRPNQPPPEPPVRLADDQLRAILEAIGGRR